jgi:cytochrome c-type biogenesis protein CcmH/NrfG
LLSASSNHKLKQARASAQWRRSGRSSSLRAGLQRAPRNPEALSLLGIAHLMGGHPAEAAARLEQAVAAAPGHGMALEHLALRT